MVNRNTDTFTVQAFLPFFSLFFFGGGADLSFFAIVLLSSLAFFFLPFFFPFLLFVVCFFRGCLFSPFFFIKGVLTPTLPLSFQQLLEKNCGLLFAEAKQGFINVPSLYR